MVSLFGRAVLAKHMTLVDPSTTLICNQLNMHDSNTESERRKLSLNSLNVESQADQSE